MMQSPRIEYDAGGIAWVVFDDPDSKINVLGMEQMCGLDVILDELYKRKPKAAVFISAKPGIFIAGADIKELEKIRAASHGQHLSQEGHRILGKIALLGVPTVAAIDGACLGGGCELALACQYRVAADGAKTQIGLPETQLGIIPGWGGSQRLPRLIGLGAALDIICAGKSVDANKARRIGLVDAAVPSVVLRETAMRLAVGEQRTKRRSTWRQNWWPMRRFICRVARKRVLLKTEGRYPAPLRAIDAIEEGLRGSLAEGLELESKIFGEVSVTSQCRHLIRLFFLREKYSKLVFNPETVERTGPITAKVMTAPVEKVGVLGAGVMGAGIAQWCSARGLTVRLRDIKPEFVAAGIKRVADAYREGVKRRKMSELDAGHGFARVHPTTEYNGFGDCDLVIEAVLEKIEVKRQAYTDLAAVLRTDAIIASNTSAIPIDELAEASGRPKRFVGIHFFNPVHMMPLVEIVRGTKTAPEVVSAAVEFAKRLKKIPVVVKGTPGFLVNRLLMPYLNEAGVLLGEGETIESIDEAMLDFGMPMGPLRLIDEVGIDVAYDVAIELGEAFKDRMAVAKILRQVHERGLKGRKGGVGFYVYGFDVHAKKKGKERVNRKLAKAIRREVESRDGKKKEPRSAGEIQRRLLSVMIEEAKRCLSEGVVASEEDIDVGMIFGTGFPPFRGGLVKYARDAGLW
ncbi:MAG TPA: 3-hydroxyacyl-CoA dehydrogenase NAD-binding domain-containing protein [Verrucomicrobiae bacterium]|nr:3-hydroxyacyl-CoA dehydrogenase NAD-binding domain-containing protein [Verrucomicrobiae bacterium]